MHSLYLNGPTYKAIENIVVAQNDKIETYPYQNQE